MELLDGLARARDEFEGRLVQVKPNQWNGPTPCSDWTVRALADHVVTGCRMTVALLDGATADEAHTLARAVPLGTDVVGEFVVAADAQEAAFRNDGVLNKTVHHRVGDIPGLQLLGFRTADYVLHAWDLARAIGGNEQLDGELVSLVWQRMEPMAPVIAQTGQFGSGPSGSLGGDAPELVRLLDLSGRRP